MAGNITDAAEKLMMDWINGVGSPTRPTTPLKVRLMTANGTDSAAGTEVTGGTYTPQSVTFTAASGTTAAASNNADLNFTLMPAATVVGVEVWDSAGTPVRLWYGALTANKTTNAGDTFTIASGSLALSLD
jgi:hypothetical protein